MFEQEPLRPSPLFKILLWLIVIGLIAGGVYVFYTKGKAYLKEKAEAKTQEILSRPEYPQKPIVAENPTDFSNITTVQEYEYVPEEKLPPVKGVSAYQKMENRVFGDKTYPVVEVSITARITWAVLLLANKGAEPNPESIFAQNYGFMVNLSKIDSPAQMVNAFATGRVHVGWATLDMIPLFIEQLRADSRAMPRVPIQFAWSNGADGLVGKTDRIQSINDFKTNRSLKGVLARTSFPHYYLLNLMLKHLDMPAAEVADFMKNNIKYTGNVYEAAAAFVNDKSIDFCVTCSPDLYNIPAKMPSTKVLVDTKRANKTLADVLFVRADFARDNPEIVQGLVRGILDAIEEIKTPEGRQKASEYMARFIQMPASNCLMRLDDVHFTNWKENFEFFLNQNNPTNFERVWEVASGIYYDTGLIDRRLRFNQTMDFTYLQLLAKVEPYASTKDEYQFTIATKKIRAEDELLSIIKYIRFPTNLDTLFKTQVNEATKKIEILYETDPQTKKSHPVPAFDPDLLKTLEEIASLAGQFSSCKIIIEGHTDISFKAVVPESLANELSTARAVAVRDALIFMYKFNPKQLEAKGLGWSRPLTEDTTQQKLNRRVEVKVLPAEAPEEIR